MARKVLENQIQQTLSINAHVVQIGPHKIDKISDQPNWGIRSDNPFFATDEKIVPIWESFLDDTRKAGSSAGALIEVIASGVPSGIGAPVINKLDADLAQAMMSINAVKAVEIGAGFEAVALSGIENADEMRAGQGEDNPEFTSNHAGGIWVEFHRGKIL